MERQEKKTRFEVSNLALARQVEIFVPKNYEKKVKMWFDSFIRMNRIPGLGIELPGKNCEYWENIVHGYSLYDGEGYFILPSRTLEDYFPEDVMIVKLILTNYLTENHGTPEILGFDPNAPAFVVDTITKDVPRSEIEAKKFEYFATYAHFDRTLNFIADSLANEVMKNEEEIWVQSWTTGLQIRHNTGVPPAWRCKLPVVKSEKEKLQRYGRDADKVFCIIDYIAEGENHKAFQPPATEVPPPLGKSSVDCGSSIEPAGS